MFQTKDEAHWQRLWSLAEAPFEIETDLFSLNWRKTSFRGPRVPSRPTGETGALGPRLENDTHQGKPSRVMSRICRIDTCFVSQNDALAISWLNPPQILRTHKHCDIGSPLIFDKNNWVLHALLRNRLGLHTNAVEKLGKTPAKPKYSFCYGLSIFALPDRNDIFQSV